MDPIRKIPKKFTKKSGNKVINRQYFRRKTGLKTKTKTKTGKISYMPPPLDLTYYPFQRP